MAKTIRLDKLLGHCGWGTRRQIKELCKSGSVFINHTCCTDSSIKIDPQTAHIQVQGETICYEEFYYLMLYKPQGVLSATEDRFTKTVLDLLPQQYQGASLFPVGRLDKDTTGLLLLTNDGTWAHQITSPKKHINKVYEASVDGLHCLPAQVSRMGPNQLQITVQEGKYHQVKRMCAAVGLTVTALHRCSIGSLVLDSSLEPGQYRRLTEVEKDLPFCE